MLAYDLIKYKNTIWQKKYNCAFPLTPPEFLNHLTENDYLYILNEYNLHLIRFETGLGFNKHTDWWHVVKSDKSNLSDYSKKVRYLIKKALSRYSYCIDSPRKHVKELYSVYVDVMERHGNFQTIYNLNDFTDAIHNLPSNIDFWIVRENVSGEIIGYAENFISDKVCFYNSIWINTDGQKNSASYGLFYSMGDYYLSERGFLYVSDGARSINHQTNVQDFLIKKFGFYKSHSELNVLYSIKLDLFMKLIRPFSFIFLKFNIPVIKKLNVLLLQDSYKSN